MCKPRLQQSALDSWWFHGVLDETQLLLLNDLPLKDPDLLAVLLRASVYVA